MHVHSTDHPFEILALDRLVQGVPELAAAAARGGGIGVIDLEMARGDVSRHGVAAVRWLLDHAPDAARIGVRLAPSQLAGLSGVLAGLDGTGATVMLTAPVDAAGLAAARGSSDSTGRRRVIAEARSIDEGEAIGAVGCDGVVAVGNETGGFVGSDTTFILLQKLLAQVNVPVYARGGLGVHAAAGCRAAGARGVVLDDQLLLAPEAGLPAAWRAHLAGLTGQETIVLGDATGRQGYRVLDRPTFGGLVRLKNVHRAIESAGEDPRGEWAEALAATLGWDAPEAAAWPIGQGVGLAGLYRRRYGTIARIVQAFARESVRLLALARRQQVLAAGAPLAQSHGTEFPIVQGPMTRVSDTPVFAAAVAEAGGLPLIALAVMPGSQAAPVLQATRDALGARPWGVGILGFVPPELKREQLQELLRARPAFALIAGGRVDEASALEASGIPTYLHTPAPSLLRRFLAQGARRFVFEGRECGGHVGPLCSFPLWESMIEVLLEQPASAEAPAVHVLFAGGIHDARSAAIVATMAAGLVERGIKIGVLMGTAYLFTEEAVRSGAILQRYQDEALRCGRTVLLTSGVGHANRVAETAFTAEYERRRLSLQRAGRPAGEIRDELERVTLGRLRLATKGLARKDRQELAPASDADQVAGGIYMLGQVATLRSRICTMIDLHREIASALPADRVGAPALVTHGAPHAHDVAVVGMALLLPGARAPETFWRNVLDRLSAIREIPADRWDMRLLFDGDRTARDRSSSKWGGFCDAIPFDPMMYRIPPAVMRHVCAHQLLTLELTRWALADAGYADRPFDREHTAVIIAAAETGGWQGNKLIVRSMLPFFFESIPERVLQRLPEWTPESFPGMLGNISAGRVANHFDLGGPNYAIDAACASSLIVLDHAVGELQSGRSRVVLAGAIDTSQTPFSFLAFSKTQALSPTGQARVFDKSADGIVCSEGVAMVVLKRVADARRDGDRIYSIVRGTGASSDGRGHGLTAPRVGGQRLALARAFESASVTAADVSLYEAHGTGTPLGDRTEIETLVGMMTEAGAGPKTCAVGSVKSLIGHTKAVAGLVGVVKASLALHHRVLPPHAGATDPLDPLRDPASPLYLLNGPRPWLTGTRSRRLVAVSAFGFGGTNGAAILEAADEADRGALGSPDWPCELFLFAAPDGESLERQVASLQAALDAGAEPRLRDLAAALADAFERGERGARLAFTASTLAELRARSIDALRVVRDQMPAAPAVHYSRAEPVQGRVAFLFPGQGSQAPGMAIEHALYFPELRDALALADRALADAGAPLSAFVYPPAAFSDVDAEAARRALAATDRAQPAIGAVSVGLLDVLTRLGLTPDAVAGHSYGELTALSAAGVLSRRALVGLSRARGRAMAQCAEGGMVSIAADRGDVERWLAGVSGLTIASHNAPQQTVVSGSSPALVEAIALLSSAGVRGTRLPVSGAFHSPLMAAAIPPWQSALDHVALSTPATVPVYSTVYAAPYRDDADQIRRGLLEQMLQPVEYVRTMERLYADGARVFIEVGPGSVLTSLTSAILGGRSAVAVSTDPLGGRLQGLLTSLGALAVSGLRFRPSRLFDDREIRPLALDRLEDTRPAPIPKSAWMVNGLTAEPAHHTAATADPSPLVTRETSAGLVDAPPRPRAVPERTLPGPTEVPALSLTADASGEPGQALLTAYAAYQQTMQRFLDVHEQTLATFMQLAGGASGDIGSLRPAAPGPGVPEVRGPEPGPDHPAPSPDHPEPRTEPAPRVITGDEIAATLLRVASAETGYPEDMLGLDLDLSTDLGVDSIRHAQILTGLVSALPAELGARLDGSMEALARASTLRAMLSHILTALRAHAAAPVPDAAAATSRLPAAGPSARREPAHVLAVLQQVTSERTGYPLEMLVPEHDLEADLGVDSIRRAEIVQAFTDRLGVNGELARDAIERIMRVRSLGEMAQLFAAPPEAVATPDTAVTAAARFVTVAVPQALTRGETGTLRAGVALITEDACGVAPLVAASLARAGATVVTIERRLLADPPAIAARLDEIDQPVRAIVHLAPLSRTPLTGDDRQWREQTAIDAKSLFTILQQVGRREPQDVRVIAASLMGGWYGRNGRLGPGLPSSGAAAGLLRCVALEWPGLVARTVDFSDGLDAGVMADRLVAELLADGVEVEIGYDGAERLVFEAARAPLLAAASIESMAAPGTPWVVLATGGARGITAQALRALARPGTTVVLAGRREPTRSPASDLDTLPAAKLRERFIAEARTRNTMPRPVDIETRVHDVLRDREILQTIARLEESGVVVVYRSCDVRNAEAFRQLIAWTYATFGRIDAVVHGAGVIEDKLLVEKQADSFDRVFDTKVDSTFVLTEALRPEGLSLVVLFASVAGRFGNRGQSDYGAANEVLNRFAWSMQERWPSTRVVAINWGPWSGTGMASEAVRTAMTERGIVPISPEAGQAFLRDEIAGGGPGDVEVIAGEGPWDQAPAAGGGRAGHQGRGLSITTS